MSGSVQIVDEYPLPLDQWEVEELVTDHPYFESDDVPHVDELHEKYVDEIARNAEWTVFHCYLIGSGIWIWNHAVGGGFRIEERESFWMLAACLNDLYDTDSTENQEP